MYDESKKITEIKIALSQHLEENASYSAEVIQISALIHSWNHSVGMLIASSEPEVTVVLVASVSSLIAIMPPTLWIVA
jgi:hypothetical protein